MFFLFFGTIFVFRWFISDALQIETVSLKKCYVLTLCFQYSGISMLDLDIFNAAFQVSAFICSVPSNAKL